MATEFVKQAARTPRHLTIGLLSEFAYPFHKGGAERRYYELAIRLSSRGHDVHWFALRHWPGEQSIQFEGIQLHAIGDPVEVYTESGRRSVSAGLRLGWALTKAIRDSSVAFDVLDCSVYPFFHVFGARAIRPRTPMIVSWYEFWGDHWYEYLGWRGFFGKQIERFASRVPAQIISVSDLAAAGLTEAGVPADRLHVVPLGVDTGRAQAATEALEASDLVSFGRLKNHKNIDVLIRAVALAAESRPGLTCAVIGDGPERDRLERLAVDVGAGENVRFFGEVEDDRDLWGLVKASKIFVNPSTKEGGGSLTVLEANACGIPVIAVRHELGIDSSLIRSGQNGWWVDRADPEELARAISVALDAVSADGAVWGQRCVEHAREYDWDVVTSRCEDIYMRAAENV